MTPPAPVSAVFPAAALIRREGRSWLVFLLVFVGLQWAWRQARGSVVEQWFIGDLTVGVLVHLIHALSPEIAAHGAGARVVAPGGGLQILNGCEGTEVLFLMVAALVAFPLRWKVRLAGLLLGCVWVFALNQMRLLALFYAFRHDPRWFDQLHAVVAPLLLIVAVLAWLWGLLWWDRMGSNQGATVASACDAG